MHALFGALTEPLTEPLTGLAQESAQDRLTQRILITLRNHPRLTAAEVACYLHTVTGAQIMTLLDNLDQAGLVTVIQGGKSIRYELA